MLSVDAPSAQATARPSLTFPVFRTRRMPSSLVPVNAPSRRFAPLRETLLGAVDAVLADGRFVLGPAVEAFERAFAEACGVAHAVGVGNGTDALELALRSVGVGAGDRVLLAANAAMYGTTAVLACGAEPVYADILPGEATLDPEAVAAALAATPGIRALLVTHLYGRLARIDALLPLARAHAVAVVEDCAQALGAQAGDGRRAGAFGDAAAFSFYPTKNLGAVGDGGAVVCNDDALAMRARALRQYGWSDKYVNAVAGGRNSRLDALQAAMLSTMLPQVDDWNARRRVIAARYADGIRHPDIVLPPLGGDDDTVHLYVVRCDRREALRRHLADAGIASDIHYPNPDHRQPCHHGRYEAINLPETERDANRVLTLPCFAEMTEDEILRVIQACNRF